MSDAEDRARRELEREQRPRTLRLDNTRAREPRVSEADEAQLTREARAREAAELAARQREIERRVDHAQQALDSLRKELGRLDRETYRDLDQARRALARIRARCAAP